MPKLRGLFSSKGKNISEQPPLAKEDQERDSEESFLNVENISSTPVSFEPGPESNKSRKKIIASYKNAAAVLQKNGFDLKMRNHEALYWACLKGQLEAVQLLLELGIRPGIYYGYKSPLHAAAEFGNCEIADALLSRGAYIMNTLPHGDMPLHSAVRRGHFDMVKFLLDRGADVLAAGDFGFTALHIAVRQGFEPIVGLLFEYGADFEATDNSVRTPLHHAALNNKYELVRKLVESGANSEARDSKGQAPIHLAGQMGNKKVFDFLQAEAKKIKERKQQEENETESWILVPESQERSDRDEEPVDTKEHRASPTIDASNDKQPSEVGCETAGNGTNEPLETRYERETGYVHPMILRWD